MKSDFTLAGGWLLVLGLVLGGTALAAGAADDNPRKPVETNTPGDFTNAPRAVFDLRAASTKDPFFPLSVRSAVPLPAVTNLPPAQLGAANFKLMGRSGTDDAILVIINGHSFAAGEKALIQPVDSPNKVAVTLLQIKPYSAVIQVEGSSAPLEIFVPEKNR
jgi:hypothetical protein